MGGYEVNMAYLLIVLYYAGIATDLLSMGHMASKNLMLNGFTGTIFFFLLERVITILYRLAKMRSKKMSCVFKNST